MRVLATDPHRAASDIAASGAVPSSFDEVLRTADVISLHVPATPSTHRLIDADKIRRMKRGAILINSARGVLVDTEALVAALHSGHLGGAALDGLAAEPPEIEHPLLQFDNVILTPHSAALTEEAMLRMGSAVAEEVLRMLAHKPPLNSVNAAV
jgi:phosphoglycerate dehydrogenase-like enzyme